MMLRDLGAHGDQGRAARHRATRRATSCLSRPAASRPTSRPSTAARSRSRSTSRRDAGPRGVRASCSARADVLVENFRPGVLAKLGYGFEVLERAAPARWCWPPSPASARPARTATRAAYDVVVQAMSGMMSITGHPGAPPARCGASIGDLAAALFACNGIQAALLQRCAHRQAAATSTSRCSKRRSRCWKARSRSCFCTRRLAAADGRAPSGHRAVRCVQGGRRLPRASPPARTTCSQRLAPVPRIGPTWRADARVLVAPARVSRTRRR